MKKRIFIVSIFLLLTMVLAACSTDQAAVEETEAEEEFYVFLPKGLDNPYWDDCRLGMEAAAEDLGVKAEFLGPEVSNAAKQVEIFENVIARKPAAIAVSPNDPATVQDSISRAMEAGIPVIAWDADAPDSERLLYIGTSNEAAGYDAGQALAEAMGGEGQVAILTGSLSALNAQQRVAGFERAIAEYPDMEIVAIEATEDSLDTALSKAEALLQAYPDLGGFFGVTVSGAPGAAGALIQSNRCGEVKVVGFDVVEQGIDYMREGCVDGLVSQRPFGMTYEALEIMIALADGASVEEVGGENIDTGVTIVTPETLEEFLNTVQ